ncbi:MAG: phosphatidylglycerophosphatase A [Paracoccus sp. (in: a-proteobacteria)]|nr:phosphatidylglycerophosphatase A [Paracoccus sp. (in: a-proteobacteria)]
MKRETLAKWLCLWFGAGLLRPAPGTWGSAVAVLIGVLIHRLGHFPLLAAATVAVTAAGFWAVRVHTAGMADPDRSEIVIDEVAGMWIALCFPSLGFMLAGLPASSFPYPGWLAAFLFFRLFDIWKPWIVGRADRRGDAAGVMLDDIYAGLMAGVATMAAAALSHLVLM